MKPTSMIMLWFVKPGASRREDPAPRTLVEWTR
jgi:hypothetical protein